MSNFPLQWKYALYVVHCSSFEISNREKCGGQSILCPTHFKKCGEHVPHVPHGSDAPDQVALFVSLIQRRYLLPYLLSMTSAKLGSFHLFVQSAKLGTIGVP